MHLKKIKIKIGWMVFCLIGCPILAMMIAGFSGIEPIRRYAEKRIPEIIGGTFSCQEARLLFFPRPHVSLTAVALSIKDRIDLKAKAVDIYPELLLALRGTIRPFRVGLVKPDVRILGPLIQATGPQKEKEAATHYFKRELERLIRINKTFPLDLELSIEKGRFSLPGKTNIFFRFRHIDMKTRFVSDQFEIEVRCASNLFRGIEFKSAVNVNTMNGSGKVEFKGLNSRTILSDLFHLKDIQTDDTRINLLVDFSIRNLADLNATIKSSLPRIILERKTIKTEIAGNHLDASLKVTNGVIELVLNELTLDDPRLSLSGRWTIDLFTPEITLELKGKEIDVASVRNRALVLMDHIPVVKTLFTVVQGGHVPEFTLISSGKTMGDLRKLSNMKIKGRLENGNILIPKVNLFLSNVTGDASISERILYGKNLEAFLDNARGCDGTLMLGLYKGASVPFFLDVFVNTELSSLPPLLGRLIRNKIFRKEMARIHTLEGEAKGHLVLGDALDHIRATVDVADFSVTDSFYDRIPFAMKSSRGRFFYEDRHIDVSGLTGVVGNSSFSDLAFSVDWKERPSLQVKAGPAAMDMTEFYPFLLSFRPIKKVCDRVKQVKGHFCIDALEMRGPIFAPRQWEFNLSGTPNPIHADAFFLGGPLRVSQGLLMVDEKDIDFDEMLFESSESTLSATGKIANYLKGGDGILLTTSGRLGKNDFYWIAGFARIPEILMPRGPFDISKGEIAYEKGRRFSLSAEGKAAITAGVKIDLTVGKEGLSIPAFMIKDEESDARLFYDQGGDEIKTAFTGKITRKTMDRLFLNNPYLEGALSGDFSLTYNQKEIGRSSARGRVEGALLTIPLTSADLILNCFSVACGDKGFHVEKSELGFLENQLLVRGEVAFAQDGFLTDLEVISERLDIKQVIDLIKTERESAKQKRGDRKPIAITGKADVRAGEVIYGKRIFSNLHSTLSFNKEDMNAFLHGAELCGVALQGSIRVSPKGVVFNVVPHAAGVHLNNSLSCLLGKKVLLDGEFDFSGDAAGRVETNSKVRVTDGSLSFYSKKGRIFNFVILAKIFSLLNVAEMLKGEFPDLVNDGFPYRSMTIKGYFKSGKFILEEAVIDNASMGITAKGEILLEDMTLNLTILIAPLQTIDLVIRYIPIVNEILGGSLVSIPVKITGGYASPRMVFLDPSAVEEGVIGLMERTLKLPFTLIKPIFSED